MTPFAARTVAEAAALLDLSRATLSTWLARQNRMDLWEETPGGRKRFTLAHIDRIREAYYRCPSRSSAPKGWGLPKYRNTINKVAINAAPLRQFWGAA